MLVNKDAVLLDTHIWLWLTQGTDRLDETKGLEAIENARKSGGIYLSIISIWEVGMLVAKGRYLIHQEMRDWVDAALDVRGLIVHPMTVGIAMNCTRLPGEIHGDPADQILVATARELDIPIVTADAKILAYSRAGHVKVIEV